MMNVTKIAVILATLIGSTSGLSATTSSCGSATWQSQPVLSNGMFQGTLYRECQVQQAAGRGIAGLHQNLLVDAVKVTTVHSGPVGETYQNMPSTYYDISDVINNASGTVTIRSDLHIASDDATRLVRANVSTDIQGTGDSAFLRKMDWILEVKPSGSTNGFTIVFWNVIQIAKPWYAPAGVFMNQATSTTQQAFVDESDRWLTSLAPQL